MGRKIAKIRGDMNEAQLLQNLERYKEKAFKLGATNAKILKHRFSRIE